MIPRLAGRGYRCFYALFLAIGLAFVCLFTPLADAKEAAPLVPGLAGEPPHQGRFVETERGYMVPYEAKIPGTDVTFTMVPIPNRILAVRYLTTRERLRYIPPMPLFTTPDDPLLHIGAVSYLNSKPLVRGLSAALPGCEVTLDLPSRLADDLAAGRLDVALVPIVEHLRQPASVLVSDACVACRGPVLSVKLHFRTSPGEVRRLALDEGSRTSAALARILLSKLHGVEPELEPLPIGDGLHQTDADAVLVIGDRAMQPPAGDFRESWDLGDRWCQWTGLPFVFAAWVARPDLPVDVDSLARTLEAVRYQGVRDVGLIVEEESARLGLSAEAAKKYLSENLHFTLGPNERRGMELFAEYCCELGLLAPNQGQEARLLAR